MLIIELINEIVEGEPGLNLYWRGQPSDFTRFIPFMKEVIFTEQKLFLSKISDIRLIGINDLMIATEKDGRCLVGVLEDKVVISLDDFFMLKIMTIFESISKRPSHNYVEFDNYNLQEEANWIISSEY